MWQEKDKSLFREFEFKDFNEAFAFMQAVAEIAASLNHHPKWTNEYNKIQIWLSTHSAGKVTEKDHELAGRIDRIYEKMVTSVNEPKLKQAKLYTDGGARGNPGPAAGAFIICKMDNSVVKKDAYYVGVSTNNQAEYQAVTAGMEAAGKLGVRKLNVFMDSELIVRQLNGQYKVKHPELIGHYQQVKSLADGFQSVTFTHVPRALNKQADAEVNRVLDEHSRK
ncbi:TPA: hypothetical protein DIS56_01540 [Candidatus Saccharibacteria bacterium]|nr:hypothetical protein [Candidatus Saccharibacteria bacterium]